MPDDLFPNRASDLFHFDDDRPSFEDLGRDNGTRYWLASDLMDILEYSNWSTFKGVINRAVQALTAASVDTIDHIQKITHDEHGNSCEDFKLSKFGCYMVAMNGDSRKPGVGLAQAWFASIAEAFQKYIQSAEDVERVQIRRELADQETTLGHTASQHGVENYAFFKDAGYLGLYNMRLSDLREYKGDPSKGKRTLTDFMGKRELAANLFRITETEARIKHTDARGQKQLERTAKNVGQEVRRTMERAGEKPEDLPLEQDVRKIATDLRKTSKKLQGPQDRKR